MRTLLVFAVVTATVAGVARPAVSVDPPSVEAKPPRPKLPTGKDLMAAKVKNAQALLEALALEDYGRMRSSAEELD